MPQLWPVYTIEIIIFPYQHNMLLSAVNWFKSHKIWTCLFFNLFPHAFKPPMLIEFYSRYSGDSEETSVKKEKQVYNGTNSKNRFFFHVLHANEKINKWQLFLRAGWISSTGLTVILTVSPGCLACFFYEFKTLHGIFLEFTLI